MPRLDGGNFEHQGWLAVAQRRDLIEFGRSASNWFPVNT
jgi:hypothetical protein